MKKIIKVIMSVLIIMSVISVPKNVEAGTIGAPTVTTTKNYGNGVLVEWDEVEGATGYVVYRRAMRTGETNWSTFARWNNTKELSFLDTKVYEGTKYQYGIKAYYGDDPTTTTKLGPVGPMSTALIYSKKPGAPTKTSTRNTDSGIEISWDAVKGATGYVIYRRAWSSTTGGWTEFQRWNNTTSTSWTDEKVYAGTRYQYGIKAYYGKDPKAMAYVGSVGPLSTNVRITTRKITSVTADGNNITVKWEGSSVFTGYQIQYATDEAFSDLKTITISNPKTVSKTFTVEDSNKTYYVRVRSFHKFEGMTYYGWWSEQCSINLSSELKDTFIYAIGGELDSLDPSSVSDSITAYVTNQTQYGLYHNENGQIVADSVKSLHVSEDGLTYTFKLVSNRWSDGKPVTADDFVYGIKHSLSLSQDYCTYQNFIYDWIVNADKYAFKEDDVIIRAEDMNDLGVTALDSETLVFTLKKRCPYFISLLTNSVFCPVRSDYAVDGDVQWANDPSVPCSGAYHFTEIDMDDHFTMTKNEYFINKEKVVTNTLIAKVIEDGSAQLSQFQNGEIDYASNPVLADCADIYSDSDEMQRNGSIVYYLNINSYGTNDVLQNRDVRRALQLGIDRTRIVESMNTGNIYYVVNGIVPEGMPGINDKWDEEHDDYIYTDYEEAIALLAGAGYTIKNEGEYATNANGKTLSIEYMYNTNLMNSTIASIIEEEYKKIGVKVILSEVDIRTFFNNRSEGLFDVARNSYAADYLDPTAYLNLMLYGTALTPTQGDETYDAMLEEASLLHGNERLLKLHDAEEYAIMEKCFIIPLVGYGSAVLMRHGAKGNIPSPLGGEMFWYIQVPKN